MGLVLKPHLVLNQDQSTLVALKVLLALNQDQAHSLTRVALKVHLVRNQDLVVLVMGLVLKPHLVLNQDQSTLVVLKVLLVLNHRVQSVTLVALKVHLARNQLTDLDLKVPRNQVPLAVAVLMVQPTLVVLMKQQKRKQHKRQLTQLNLLHKSILRLQQQLQQQWPLQQRPLQLQQQWPLQLQQQQWPLQLQQQQWPLQLQQQWLLPQWLLPQWLLPQQLLQLRHLLQLLRHLPLLLLLQLKVQAFLAPPKLQVLL